MTKETAEVQSTAHAQLLRAYEAKVRVVEADLQAALVSAKRSCALAVAQAACARDTVREQSRLEQLAAVGKARRDHEVRVRLSSETLARDVRVAERVAEDAFAAARDQYDRVVNDQCRLLQEAKEAYEWDSRVARDTARAEHKVEVEALESAVARQEEEVNLCQE